MSTDRETVERFLASPAEQATLGLVYGRRRIGKSTLLNAVARDQQGFYWEATRSTTAVQLERLGRALGDHHGTAPLALANWEDAFTELLRLGEGVNLPVVIDEFGYILEADRSVDSVVAGTLAADARVAGKGRARLILCGSAVAMMRSLTAGEAPLRGRAGMELVMQPADFRGAWRCLAQREDLELATRVYAVIGGVIGYATDMVDHDLPSDRSDFDRWVIDRLLSPAATLHHEATTLLAEDPDISTPNAAVHHSILGAIANGSVTAGSLSKRLAKPASNLDPPLKQLINAGYVLRQNDPIRSQRPQYSLADPFLQFHYAVLEPHGTLLRERDTEDLWSRRLQAPFDSQVRGPVFEEQARAWVRRYADEGTLGGYPDHVGPSVVAVNGFEQELDVVVATHEGRMANAPPSERTVLALGEAKAGETVGGRHLRNLERARAALGPRATTAKILLFAVRFSDDLAAEAGRRPDVELVGLDRLYNGS